MPRGIHYAINNVGVTSPDEEVWTPIVVGSALTEVQRRSPYWRLEWRRQVVDECNLDWFDHDNTVLTSLVCRPDGEVNEWQIFTDVICQSVVFRQRHGVGTELVATFLVNVD